MTDLKIAKTALLAYRHLEKAAEKIDAAVKKNALAAGRGNATDSTYEQVERILALVNAKGKLCALKVAVDGALAALPYEKQIVLKMRYVRGLTFESTESAFNFTKRTYFRRVNAALAAFAAALPREGFSDEEFERDYLSQKWIRNIYARLTIPRLFRRETTDGVCLSASV